MNGRWGHWRRWRHGVCDAQLLAALRERDTLETRVFQLQKSHEDLQEAYRALAESALMSFKPADLGHLFEEEDLPEDKRTFLTPRLEDREGESV